MGGMLKRFWQIIKSLKAWQWLLILIPLLFIEATLLRFDHLKMNDLKQAVVSADEYYASAQDSTAASHDLEQALTQLKQFTETHTIITVVEQNGLQQVHFGSGPVYLENLYLQQATAALQRAEQELANSSDENPNGNVFAKAMEVCKPQAITNGWAWNSPGYLSCMTNEINSYPTTDSITDTIKADLPSTNLYRYDFASPIWAPTPAGFVALACLAVAVVILVKFIIWAVVRLSLLISKKSTKSR